MTACSDKAAKLWDVRKGTCLKHFDHKQGVFSVAVSPNGKYLATASGDGTVQMLAIENAECVWQRSDTSGAKPEESPGRNVRGPRERVNSVVFSPDGGRLLTASDDRMAIVWDAKSGEPERVLKGHNDKVNWAVFSPDGKRLATASWDETARVWEASSGTELFRLVAHGDVVNGVDFSPYGGRLATAGWDGAVKIWDSESGREVRTLSISTGGFTRVAFGRTGKRVATAGQDWIARVWQVDSGLELLTLSGHTGVINCVTFSPDAERLASASWDRTVKLWSVGPRGHRDAVTNVAFSADSKRVATASRDGTAKIWDIESGEERHTLRCRARTVLGVAFDHQGTLLMTAGWNGRAIEWSEWEVESGRELSRCSCQTENVRAVTFSPDRQRLMTVGDDGIARVWIKSQSQADSRCWASVSREFNELAFSTDGTRLAIAGSDPVVKIMDLGQLWNGEGECDVAFRQGFPTGHSQLMKGLAFSPDGQRLATASFDGNAKVWDLNAEEGEFGKELRTFTYKGIDGAACPVDEVALSPDGKLLAATGFDGTLKVWNIDSQKTMNTDSPDELFGYSDQTVRLSGVAFSPDARCLVALTRTGTVQFYDLELPDLMRTAENLLAKMGQPTLGS